MKRTLRFSSALLLAAAVSATALAVGCRRVPAPRDIPVLMYHNILPDSPDLSVWQVSVDEFARQMDQLAEAGYTPILPEDIARAAEGRGSLPDKPIVITFDDGYEGVMVNAEPILAAHGFKGICYAVVGLLAGEGPDRGSFDSGPLLSTNEAVAMNARGVVVIGSHTMTHPRNNPHRLAGQIVPSRKALLDLGIDTTDYCYPFGLHGYDFMYDALHEAGFRTALACGDEMFRFGVETNLLAIPRVSMYGGHHDIACLGVADDGAHVLFANSGHDIPLRAVVRDPATGRSWSSDLFTVGGPDPVAVPFPPEALDGPRVIEAWDKFGIFRYVP